MCGTCGMVDRGNNLPLGAAAIRALEEAGIGDRVIGVCDNADDKHGRQFAGYTSGRGPAPQPLLRWRPRDLAVGMDAVCVRGLGSTVRAA